ncbi:hypothetical protein BKA62DRAFT_110679 [Auriculariales sp. MPI-PUGE-AT-0066]|nr:hypothetical protein BKA62DRAFT_110679 [Auriculariales sp. MPI-PUGE-AT-0066]
MVAGPARPWYWIPKSLNTGQFTLPLPTRCVNMSDIWDLRRSMLPQAMHAPYLPSRASVSANVRAGNWNSSKSSSSDMSFAVGTDCDTLSLATANTLRARQLTSPVEIRRRFVGCPTSVLGCITILSSWAEPPRMWRGLSLAEVLIVSSAPAGGFRAHCAEQCNGTYSFLAHIFSRLDDPLLSGAVASTTRSLCQREGRCSACCSHPSSVVKIERETARARSSRCL